MPKDPKRILIVRPSALGDVCRTVPVLASLKRAFPDARIDWLVQDTFADAVRAHPALHSVVEFPRARFAAWWKPSVAADLVRWLRGLATERYDIVVDCQGLARSGFFTWCTRSERRVGYAQAAELGWLGLTERVRVPWDLHAVDRMLALVEAVGVEPALDLRLYVPAEIEPKGRLNPRSLSGRHAVIAPTSRWAGKRWPPARFANVVEFLLGPEIRMDRVVVVGSRAERDQCGALLDLAARDTRVVDAMGKTSVAGLMEVVRGCALVVGNDSACLHMAVGFDRPLVGLYGPTHIGLVGPYGRDEQVVQRTAPGEVLDHKNARAGLRIMERIGVEDVCDKIRTVIGPRAGRSERGPGLTSVAVPAWEGNVRNKVG
jgi:heptosyltransferase I